MLVLAGAPIVAGRETNIPILLPITFHIVSNAGWVLFVPTCAAFVATYSPERWRGTMLGLNMLTVSVAGFLSGPLSGIYEKRGPTFFWTLIAFVPIAGGAALLVTTPLLRRLLMRRQRLAAARQDVPPVLWIVALVGSILTIAYASAFVSSRYALLMIAGTSLTIGLLFLFLLSVDYPFRNRNGVSDAPFVELKSVFDTIDRFSARMRAPPPRAPSRLGGTAATPG